MLRSAENILAAGSMGVALLLMWPGWHAGPLVLDEHAAYWLCAPEVPLSIFERSARYAAVPPLASWTQAASLFVLGNSELALRLPSLLAYLFAVGAMAFGGRPLIGGMPAALGAIALAMHPDVVDEVRVGRTYGLVVLLMTLLLLITLRWQKEKIGWRNGFLWGVTAAAAVWTHILTIPVVALSAILLGFRDVWRYRSLHPATVIGWGVAGVTCLPLVPMGERIWTWRNALNYQTENVSLPAATGPFVWLGLPLAVGVAIVARYGRRLGRHMPQAGHGEPRSASTLSSAMTAMVVMGVVPLLLFVAVGQGDLSSLANPRYRIPVAAANACLLGLLCNRARNRWWATVCLGVTLAATWAAVGHGPMQRLRLNTPQAAVWKEMGEALARTVDEQHLQQAPVFVQSGLIEGVLIPTFPEDRLFHAYISSRLGRFYADTPNPRYALPLFWDGDNRELWEFFQRTLAETAAASPSDLFVAVATDTDVNRRSFETFAFLLDRWGYQGEVLAGHQTWAVLYHYRRRSTTTPE